MFVARDTGFDVSFSFRIVRKLFYAGFHVCVVMHEVKHCDTRILGELLVYLLSAWQAHSKLEDAFITYE